MGWGTPSWAPSRVRLPCSHFQANLHLLCMALRGGYVDLDSPSNLLELDTVDTEGWSGPLELCVSEKEA